MTKKTETKRRAVKTTSIANKIRNGKYKLVTITDKNQLIAVKKDSLPKYLIMTKDLKTVVAYKHAVYKIIDMQKSRSDFPFVKTQFRNLEKVKDIKSLMVVDFEKYLNFMTTGKMPVEHKLGVPENAGSNKETTQKEAPKKV